MAEILTRQQLEDLIKCESSPSPGLICEGCSLIVDSWCNEPLRIELAKEMLVLMDKVEAQQEALKLTKEVLDTFNVYEALSVIYKALEAGQ